MIQQRARGERGHDQRGRQAVIRLLRERGGLSRAEIARGIIPAALGAQACAPIPTGSPVTVT